MSDRIGWIVVGWMRHTRRLDVSRAYLAERLTWTDIEVPVAATWRIGGTADDVKKAEDFAAGQHGGRVFQFEAAEEDPLTRARAATVSP